MNGSLIDNDVTTQESSDQFESNGSQSQSTNNKYIFYMLKNRLFLKKLLFFSVEIDYALLPESIRQLNDKDEIKKAIDSMEFSLKKMRENVDRMQAPSSRINEKLTSAQDRYLTTNEEFEILKKKDRACKHEFEKVKDLRRTKFMGLFDKIVEKIDEIYKVSF